LLHRKINKQKTHNECRKICTLRQRKIGKQDGKEWQISGGKENVKLKKK
jgi:hypothetical protein